MIGEMSCFPPHLSKLSKLLCALYWSCTAYMRERDCSHRRSRLGLLVLGALSLPSCRVVRYLSVSPRYRLVDYDLNAGKPRPEQISVLLIVCNKYARW
jgi:hypothetical protein